MERKQEDEPVSQNESEKMNLLPRTIMESLGKPDLRGRAFMNTMEKPGLRGRAFVNTIKKPGLKGRAFVNALGNLGGALGGLRHAPGGPPGRPLGGDNFRKSAKSNPSKRVCLTVILFSIGERSLPL